MSEDSGNLGGTVNLCSPSPSTFRPLCPYSPSSSPSYHSIVSPLPDNRLPVCSPPHSSSPPCTSSPVVLLLGLIVLLLIVHLRAIIEVGARIGAIGGVGPWGAWEG